MTTFNENSIPFLNHQQCADALVARPKLASPFLVFSTVIGGWTDSPIGLNVGLDDHGFHRGDAVFEALQVHNRKPHLLRDHWDRMQKSLEFINLRTDMTFEKLQKIIQVGVEKFPEPNASLRMFCTRGPGGFAADMRESVGSQFYCVMIRFKGQDPARVAEGIRIGRSAIPVKAGWLANAKTLNYLPNVMMKKESVDRGLDFTVSFDENNFLAESATENLIVLMKDGRLAHPNLGRILRGCTMMRLFDLVESSGLLPVRRNANLTEQDLIEAQGLFMISSHIDVLPIREYEGHAIPMGPWGPKLVQLLKNDLV